MYHFWHVIYTEKSFEDTLKDPPRKEAICLIQMSFSPNMAVKKHWMFHTREDEKKTKSQSHFYLLNRSQS